MTVIATPVHRSVAAILGLALVVCATVALVLFQGLSALWLVTPLAVFLCGIWYWAVFRWHWRVVYECDASGVRLLRAGRLLRQISVQEISRAENKRGAIVLRLRRGGTFLLHPEHSAEKIVVLLSADTVTAPTTSAIDLRPKWGRVFCVSSVVFAGCAALFLCEMEGFRVFDRSLWGIHSKESGFISPSEMLIFFGGIALGIVAGIVTLASALVWLVQHFWYPQNHSNRSQAHEPTER